MPPGWFRLLATGDPTGEATVPAMAYFWTVPVPGVAWSTKLDTYRSPFGAKASPPGLTAVLNEIVLATWPVAGLIFVIDPGMPDGMVGDGGTAWLAAYR